MSSVLGIDFSSQAVDLVYLDETAYVARWHRIRLGGGWYGVRKVRHSYAWRSELENAGVYLVAVEAPHGRGHFSIAALARVQGAILASLPLELAVWLLPPAEWKIGVGLKGNVSTQPRKPGAMQLRSWAYEHGADGNWPIDACAALAMAYTAREINAQAVAGAA